MAGGCAIYYVTYCVLLLVSTIHNTEKATSSQARCSGAVDPAPARPKLHCTPASWVQTLYAELKRVICRGGAISGHTVPAWAFPQSFHNYNRKLFSMQKTYGVSNQDLMGSEHHARSTITFSSVLLNFYLHRQKMQWYCHDYWRNCWEYSFNCNSENNYFKYNTV